MMDERKPVDYDELFPGRFIKAGELKGKAVTLQIRSVDKEELPQDNGANRTRGVISFERTKKQWVLNKTNGECLKAMFGREVQQWVGKRVTIVPEKDRFGLETVDCIRIKGSPDISVPIDCVVKLPRRKPKTRRLVPTGSNGDQPAAPPSTPEQGVPPGYELDKYGELIPMAGGAE